MIYCGNILNTNSAAKVWNCFKKTKQNGCHSRVLLAGIQS